MAHDAQSVFAAPLATVRMPVALVDLANEFQRRRFGDGDAEGNVALLVFAKPTAAVDTAIEMALRSVVDALPPTNASLDQSERRTAWFRVLNEQSKTQSHRNEIIGAIACSETSECIGVIYRNGSVHMEDRSAGLAVYQLYRNACNDITNLLALNRRYRYLNDSYMSGNLTALRNAMMDARDNIFVVGNSNLTVDRRALATDADVNALLAETPRPALDGFLKAVFDSETKLLRWLRNWIEGNPPGLLLYTYRHSCQCCQVFLRVFAHAWQSRMLVFHSQPARMVRILLVENHPAVGTARANKENSNAGIPSNAALATNSNAATSSNTARATNSNTSSSITRTAGAKK
jgi:hypothetical protein